MVRLKAKLFDLGTKFWKSSTVHHTENNIQKVKPGGGGGSIMLWGSFSSAGMRKLIRVEGGDVYRARYRENSRSKPALVWETALVCWSGSKPEI